MSDWLAIFEGAAFALTVKGDMYKFISKVFEGVDGIAIETVLTLDSPMRSLSSRSSFSNFCSLCRNNKTY